MDKQFWLMDGRANYDIDEAIVLTIYDTLQDAKNHINDYGADTCIVKMEGDDQELVYSLLWEVSNE